METNKELLASLEATRKQIDAQIEQLNKEFIEPEFEVGKWYKPTILDSICCYQGNKTGYGISHCSWSDSIKISDRKQWIEATKSEVFEALNKEAENERLKKGITIKSCVNVPNNFKAQYNGEKLEWNGEDLYFKDIKSGYFVSVFRNGKWAEIIKDEPVIIGGYEVKKHPDEDVYTTIDGNIFTKEFWQAAKLISEHSKAKIMIGCSKQFDVDLKTINKILSL